MKIKILFLSFLFLNLPFCRSIVQNRKPNFSSPQQTIHTYYKFYSNREVLSNCFYPSGYNGSLKKVWEKYKIKSVKRTDKVGKVISGNLEINKEALEVIVEVKMNQPEKRNPWTKFWYLLQKFKDEWKIIDFSHIPDEKYPAYD